MDNKALKIFAVILLAWVIYHYGEEIKRDWFADIPPGAENITSPAANPGAADLVPAKAAFAKQYQHMAAR